MACFEYDYNPGADQPRQQRDWDCSAAATAWMGRSIGWGWQELDVAYAFQTQGLATPALGLLDGTGAGIVGWLAQQPLTATNSRVSYADLIERDWSCPLIMGSSRWYHWVGVRGVDQEGVILLANSAPGWGDVWQELSLADFRRFDDFWAVYLTA